MKKISLLLVIVSAYIIIGCTENISGGTSTGNSAISGIVSNMLKDDTVTVDARLSNFINSFSDNVIASDTVDSLGNYELLIDNFGIYTLTFKSKLTDKVSIVSDINLLYPGDITITTELKNSGIIKVNFTPKSPEIFSAIFIPGTDFYAVLTDSTYISLSGVPSGIISALKGYRPLDGSFITIDTNLIVPANDTLFINYE